MFFHLLIKHFVRLFNKVGLYQTYFDERMFYQRYFCAKRELVITNLKNSLKSFVKKFTNELLCANSKLDMANWYFWIFSFGNL